MRINPIIVGRGMAGQALGRAVGIVGTLEEDLEILPATFATRGTPLKEYIKGDAVVNLLCIANPHGLHVATLAEGVSAGFQAALVEKPVAVTREDLERIRAIEVPVGVCHGYRMMWGPQTMKAICARGDIGELFAIEGRYVQSSSAQAALSPQNSARHTWKNTPALSGPSDALFDLGSHWADLAVFLAGALPDSAQAKRFFVNSSAAHRDSHVHLDLQFSSGVAARSTISKTFHGMANTLEVSLLGSKGALTWHFLNPDEIIVGQGGGYSVLRRTDSEFGSCQRPFHALGWLEGYIEIARQTIKAAIGRPAKPVPSLKEQAGLFEVLFALVEGGGYTRTTARESNG
jgi:predicted dehydrogenase